MFIDPDKAGVSFIKVFAIQLLLAGVIVFLLVTV